MKAEFTESTIGDVVEGDVVVAIKYRGKTYAKAFRFDDKVGEQVKASLEATLWVLKGGEDEA